MSSSEYAIFGIRPYLGYLIRKCCLHDSYLIQDIVLFGIIFGIGECMLKIPSEWCTVIIQYKDFNTEYVLKY